MAQTQGEIRAILAAAGISPLKRFGQNFLVDANLMRKLVQAAEIGPADVVLEVGPGTGSLTERLLELAGHVMCVEIDRGLQTICRERFDARPNFTLIAGDALGGRSRVIPELLDGLRRQQSRLGGRILLVSNLPYQIATPLVVELIMGELSVSPLCFTVQAEVGDRMAAGPGGKEYGPVSIFAQALGKVRRIARVPPESFWPAPTVHSVMLKWERDPNRAMGTEARAGLSRVVHHCFQHRRKTLRSCLRTLVGSAALETLEGRASCDLDDRPERLTPDQWIQLSQQVA
jgi:16S rRNA (adenine1518-N6/adenine1519-N6)-dimethyltransferase